MDGTRKRRITATPQSRRDFEIAILCALEIESNAVEASFDEFYDEINYGKSTGDPNVYTLGRIDRHNVVLVYPPEMGKVASASVMSSLQFSFPNIQLGLVVGICGGVPKPPSQSVEIFLGDIIISTGVVQHDYGRQYADRMVRKDTPSSNLGRPKEQIRAHLRKIQGWHGKKQLHDDFTASLTALASKDGFAHCQFPGSENDQLYESSYLHRHRGLAFCTGGGPCSSSQGENVCEGARSATCVELGCDQDMLVKRRRLRPPVSSVQQGRQTTGTQALEVSIHLGPIASGDLVIKSGLHRDRIAREEKIIAFEMEGAGMWDRFPTIIIKSVSDYADSHKNKLWQNFSTIAAAACAKAFLQGWGSPDRSELLSNSHEMRSEGTLQRGGFSPQSPQYTSKLDSSGRFPSFLPSQRNPRFAARVTVLAELEQHYEKRSPKFPFILRGMGGIGKTQIALEYAHRRNDRGSVVFWVSCFSLDSIIDSFKQIERTIVKGINQDGNQEVDKVNVLDWLKYNGNWILVFDNADDDSITYSDWLPMPRTEIRPAGQVIFTSRDARLAGSVFGTNKEVPLMTGSEAIELFKSSNPNDLESRNHEVCDIELLVERVANLPLAVSLASAYLRQCPWMSTMEYLKHLDDFAGRQKLLGYKEVFSSYNHSIMSTWELSFERVQQCQPNAAKILLLLGFLANGSVTLKSLSSTLRETISDRTSIPIQVRPVVSERLQFLKDDTDLIQALGLLRSLALIDFGGSNIALHPLVHQWIQARLTVVETEEWVVNALLVLFCTHVASRYPLDGFTIEPLQRSFEHDGHMSIIIGAADRCAFQNTEVPYEVYLCLLTYKALLGDTSQDGISQSQMKPRLTEGRGIVQRVRNRLALDSHRRSNTKNKKTGSKYADLVSPQDTHKSNDPLVNAMIQHDLLSRKEDFALMSEIARARERMRASLAAEVAPYIPELCDTAWALAKLFSYTKYHFYLGTGSDLNETTRSDICTFYLNISDNVVQLAERFRSTKSPPLPLIETLFYWTSLAALNRGRLYPVWLEKALEPTKLKLYLKACDLGHSMGPQNSVPVMPYATISLARYLDTRNLHGPTYWLPAEHYLITYLTTTMEHFADSLAIDLVEFLCLSMWECEHEEALWLFCNMIEPFYRRISLKWTTKVSDRWTILGKAEASFDNLTASEIKVIEDLTDMNLPSDNMVED